MAENREAVKYLSNITGLGYKETKLLLVRIWIADDLEAAKTLVRRIGSTN